MTEITVTAGKDGYMNIEAKGHTEDIVCASVSTLLQSSVRFLQDLSYQYPNALKVTVKEQK